MESKRLIILGLAAILIFGFASCKASPVNQENNTQVSDGTENQPGGQDSPLTPDEGIAPEEADFPAKEQCSGLGSLLEEHMSLDSNLKPKTFSDLSNGINGEGCQVSVIGTGDMVGDWGSNSINFIEAMFNDGWAVDTQFSAALESGQLLTVRKDDYVCMYYAAVSPGDPSLCLPEESITACLERLEGSFIVYETIISCSTDKYVPEEELSAASSDQEDSMISFSEGEISTFVNGKLEPASMETYVLQAVEGQELVVNLINSPPHQGTIEIYGEDGTRLTNDQENAAFWSGVLPSTQDYFIDVRSSAEYALAYDLQVVLTPKGDMFTGAYIPPDPTVCEGLSNQLSSLMGVEAKTSKALFYDYITQGAGEGCQISAWGTLDNYPDRSAISTTIRSALAADGWYGVQEYDVEGPGGFGTGYFKDDNLCLYFELVHELDPWACEANDSSIFNCWNGLDQTEMYLEIQMTCATGK